MKANNSEPNEPEEEIDWRTECWEELASDLANGDYDEDHFDNG